MNGPVNQISIWHLLYQLLLYAPRLYLLDSLLWMFIMGLPAVPGLIIREFFNHLTDSSSADFSSATLIVLLLATGAARIVAIFMGRITKTQHRFTISGLLQRNLLAGILCRPGALPLVAGEKNLSSGEVLSYFREDVAQIEDNVVGTNEILGAGVFAAVSLIILLSVNVYLTIFVFLPLVAIAAIVQQAETRIKRYRRASRQATQQVTGLIGEIFTAVQAIQVAGAESPVLERFRQVSQQRQQAIIRDQVFLAILESILQNMVNLGTGLILLLASQTMRPAQALSVGDFALFVYYLAFVTDFFWFLGGFLSLSKQTEVSFDRMADLLQDAEPLPAENAPLSLVVHAPLYIPNLKNQASPLPAIESTIRHAEDSLNTLSIVGLTYRYPDTNCGISDINFQVQRGNLTVITGRIGSGKTTLLRTLLGLLPRQAGEIYWNERLIQQPASFFIPPRSAYTPQVPTLFSTTLQENLQLGLDRSNQDLAQAISRSILVQDIAAMPEGLNTEVGTRGVRLSGGQIQRVAAARMFLHQPELLVFDDLSSALDVETERRLWSHLLELRQSRGSQGWTPTCLVVSHRPALLQAADQVIVLENGTIVSIEHQ
ncbi:MAG: ABC transporter ATP-binding protein [Elainella sp. C42_A2020_010]|nr:ABC transporter ATP-binding protein [Elainella sp. C42_A2020_010]